MDDSRRTLQGAVDAVEGVSDLLSGLTAQTWRPALSEEARTGLQVETGETCRWARVVLKRAIQLAEACGDEATAHGALLGPVTRVEALERFHYLLATVRAGESDFTFAL